MSRSVEVIAHRGASADAPENTLAAFRLARQQGADWFELDCCLSADGQAVVIHDDTVDRTTNGQGPVSGYTLKELQALDAGAWKSPEFTGEPVPSLEETLALASRDTGVYIEIKPARDDRALHERLAQELAGSQATSADLAAKAMRIIADDGTPNLTRARTVAATLRSKPDACVTAQSFSPVICAALRVEMPGLAVEMLGQYAPEQTRDWERSLAWVAAFGIRGLNLGMASAMPERIAMLRGCGLRTAVWTVDDPADMLRFARSGATAIITNRPAECRTVLRKNSLC